MISMISLYTYTDSILSVVEKSSIVYFIQRMQVSYTEGALYRGQLQGPLLEVHCMLSLIQRCLYTEVCPLCL